jgi:Sulfotransferase family
MPEFESPTGPAPPVDWVTITGAPVPPFPPLIAPVLVSVVIVPELGRCHRAYRALTTHWGEILPASHFVEVDYEAVVDDVAAQAQRMLEFLGLPWNDSVLRFHETKRPVRTASVNQVRQPI